MAKKKLMFPNPQAEDEAQIDAEDQQMREHIALMKEEAKLESEREKRKGTKRKRLSDASLRKMDRKRKAIAMRMRNVPLDVIADRLGISPSYAYTLIREAVSEMPLESAEEMRKLLTRTAVKIMGDFNMASEEGDTKSATVMLKSIERLTKLAGLDVQKKEVEVSELGSVDRGIDVAELDLDLETKKKVLEAIRKKKNETKEKGEKDAGSDEKEGD